MIVRKSSRKNASNLRKVVKLLGVILVLGSWFMFFKHALLISKGIQERNVSKREREIKLSQLLQWGRERGAIVPEYIKFAFDETTGWGFFSTKDLKSGELVCDVPSTLLLYSNEEEGSPVFDFAKQLLRTRTISPYVASLPWDEIDINRISDFDDDIEKAWQGLDEEWNYSEFRKACLLVMSRVHRIIDGKLALVPICDMFNTVPARGSYSLNVDCSPSVKDRFRCLLLQDVQPNSQLFVEYRDSMSFKVSEHSLKSQWGIQ